MKKGKKFLVAGLGALLMTVGLILFSCDEKACNGECKVSWVSSQYGGKVRSDSSKYCITSGCRVNKKWFDSNGSYRCDC